MLLFYLYLNFNNCYFVSIIEKDKFRIYVNQNHALILSYIFITNCNYGFFQRFNSNLTVNMLPNTYLRSEQKYLKLIVYKIIDFKIRCQRNDNNNFKDTFFFIYIKIITISKYITFFKNYFKT